MRRTSIASAAAVTLETDGFRVVKGDLTDT